MTFVYPDWLFALAALPAVAWLLAAGLRRLERRLGTLIDTVAWPTVLPNRQVRYGSIVRVTAALGCLILALARPQWGFRWEDVPQRGLNVLVALDTSNSMLTEDLKPNRLQRAQWGIRDLAEALAGDRLGLIAFAGSAFVQCPLTTDLQAFRMTLDDVYAGIVPRGGTAFAPALKTALDMLDPESTADTVLVFISDGEDLEGGWEPWVEELRKRKIRIYGIGIGTQEGGLVPLSSGRETLGSDWRRNEEGNPVLSRLQENTLEQMALATGGLYVRAASADFGVGRIKEQIEDLKRAELEGRRVRVPRERFGWFVGAALLLLGLDAVWIGKHRERSGSEAEGEL
ncbi:MAG: VWA domain-containing protein [Kiritimatiellia bacterium]|nr:VWA domain-containing protein [Kiritimatiellia bacterium]